MNQEIIETFATHADFHVGNEHSDKSYEAKQRLWLEMYTRLVVDRCMDLSVSFNNNLQSLNDKEMRSHSSRVGDYLADYFGVEK